MEWIGIPTCKFLSQIMARSLLISILRRSLRTKLRWPSTNNFPKFGLPDLAISWLSMLRVARTPTPNNPSNRVTCIIKYCSRAAEPLSGPIISLSVISAQLDNWTWHQRGSWMILGGVQCNRNIFLGGFIEYTQAASSIHSTNWSLMTLPSHVLKPSPIETDQVGWARLHVNSFF